MNLPSSVASFVPRAVSLLGIDSVLCPLATRKIAWKRLESDLDGHKLAEITSEIRLGEVLEAAQRVVEGQVRRRLVVKIR